MKIDPHVHFRDDVQNYKETISHGLSIAKSQGVDIVFDMPNTTKPILNKEGVEERLKYVPKDKIDSYYMYIGATTNDSQLKEAIELVNTHPKVIAIKMYAGKSTGNLAIINENDEKKVYQVLTDNNYEGIIAVHCEKEEFMINEFDPNNPISHALNRPNKAEIESIKDQIRFVKETNFKGTLHICHISCKESIEIVTNEKEEFNKGNNKFKITCGVTPHHILWTMDKLSEANGLLYKMNPPLRSKEDVEGLKEALKNNQIDWIETDHVPHSIGEKLFCGYPSGFPTLYVYKEFIEKITKELNLTEEQIKNLTFNNIVKAFNLEGKLL